PAQDARVVSRRRSAGRRGPLFRGRRTVEPEALMTEEESNNVALLQKGYALWAQSKAPCEGVSCWMDMVADDVQWRSLAAGAAGVEFTRGCCSKCEVQRYFEELGKDWEMIAYK